MQLGLIAYADDTGLGNQTKAYYDHFKPAKTMVLNRTNNRTPHAFYPERYPGGMMIPGVPTFSEVDAFLDGLDVVLMAEVSPTQYLLRRARERGVKTVIVPNYEYWHNLQKKNLLHPDLYMPGTLWHFEEYPDPKVYIPYPLNPPVGKAVETVHNKAVNFVHVGGDPIMPDRNGTFTVLKAMEHITAHVKITVFCRNTFYLDQFFAENDVKVPENVEFVRATSVANVDDLYAGQDVLLMPRRFGGLCLPVNEAIERGLPVIMPDISPNNQWLPKGWLVPATKIDERKMSTMIDIYEVAPKDLAKRIDTFATATSAYVFAAGQARGLADKLSWEALTPKYLETLTSMVE